MPVAVALMGALPPFFAVRRRACAIRATRSSGDLLLSET